MKNLVLREVLSDHTVNEYVLNKVFQTSAQPGAVYSVLDITNNTQPDDLQLRRRGDLLEVRVADKPVVQLDEFYGTQTATLYSVNGELNPPKELSVSGVVATEEKESIVWWQYVPMDLDQLMPPSAGESDASDKEIEAASGYYDLTVTATAGRFQSDATVSLYDRFGNLIGIDTIDPSNGQATLAISQDYQGPVLVELQDSNGLQGDYIDVTTASLTSLNTSLRAMTLVDGTDKAISITPLTELAAREAALIGKNVSTSNVEVNERIGKLFGVDDILAPVTTVLEPGFNTADGLTAAEHYGLVLASLSGTDSVTGHITTTLHRLANATSSSDDALALTQGAVILLQDGINAFQNSQSADLAEISLSLIQTPIVDVPAEGVNAQARNQGVTVSVSGVTEGDTVTLHWGTQSITKVLCNTDVDANGMALLEVSSQVISNAGIGFLDVKYQINDQPPSPSVILEIDTIHDSAQQEALEQNSYGACSTMEAEQYADISPEAQQIIDQLWQEDALDMQFETLLGSQSSVTTSTPAINAETAEVQDDQMSWADIAYLSPVETLPSIPFGDPTGIPI